jgi:hypothetical protein
MTDKHELPEEIRDKLLKKKAAANEDEELDDADLDQVAGGAYTGHNNAGDFAMRLGRGSRLTKNTG